MQIYICGIKKEHKPLNQLVTLNPEGWQSRNKAEQSVYVVVSLPISGSLIEAFGGFLHL